MFPFRRAERHRPAAVRNPHEGRRIAADLVAHKSFADARANLRHVR
jgi:hypothetical protein